MSIKEIPFNLEMKRTHHYPEVMQAATVKEIDAYGAIMDTLNAYWGFCRIPDIFLVLVETIAISINKK